MSVTVRFLYGGTFYVGKDIPDLNYRRQLVYAKKDVDPDLLSRIELEAFLKEGCQIEGVTEFWFAKSGVKLHDGIQEIKSDKDILDLCGSVTSGNTLDVYVVQKSEISPNEILDFENGRKPRNPSQLGSPTPKSPPNVGGPIKNDSAKPKVTPKTSDLTSSQFTPRSTLASTSKHTPILSTLASTSGYTPNLNALASSSKYTPYLSAKTTSSIDNLKSSLATSYKLLEEDEDCGSSSDDDEEELLGSESSYDDSDDVLFEENIFGEKTDDDDDGDFLCNVDEDVVDENLSKEDGEPNIVDCFDIRVESDDYRSFSGSDDTIHLRYPEFNPLVDFKSKICFKPGMRFASNEVFRKALRQYAVEHGFDYYYLHNDSTRVSAYCLNKCKCGLKNGRKKCKCKENQCGFKACARKMGKDGSFQLKSFVDEHNCGWQDRNTKMTSSWLAEKYLEHYRDDPQWRIKAFIYTIRREHSVEVTYHQAWRARMKALLLTLGYAPEQYAAVWDYAAALLRHNPGSSVYVRPAESPERPLKFERFYVCLNACKVGFLNGCRPIVGLDGCHLKGVYTGQVLTAVAKDGNENIFPIAYAVVEIENKVNWCWFIELLLNDIGSKALTFMSDRAKGLLEALAEVAPRYDTRVCVRHMHNNFKKQWPGKSFKDAVWAAAKSSTLPDFENAMTKIREMDIDAEKYLMKQDPRTWSLHAFRYYPKTDMQLNNACESFNSCILEARELPILSMCEWIRRKLMKMFISKRNKMRAHQGFLTPEIIDKLNAMRADSVCRCQCHGDGDLYEVDSAGRTYVVNLAQRTCGCNMWEITGLPCQHAICCILKRRLRVEDYVHEYYHKETYMRAYGESIGVMPGQDQWEKTANPPLDPPKLVVQPGRPKKQRRKEPGEQSKGKVSRVRTGKNKCGNCGQEGHIRKTCKNPPKAPDAPTSTNKGGRPRKESTLPILREKRKYTKRKGRTNAPEQAEDYNPVQMATEQDQDVQAMIEQAMINTDENAIATQVSQTGMPQPSSQFIGESNPVHPSASTSATQKMRPRRRTRSSTSSQARNL